MLGIFTRYPITVIDAFRPTGFVLLMLVFGVLVLSCKKSKEDVLPMEEALVDEFGLLTDAGLVYPLDADAPEENLNWVDGVNANHHPIRSLESSLSFTDLQFLEPILRNVSMIQLGESGHGVKQFNQAKIRLIKYLHEELGFNVLAFESGFFDCQYTNDHTLQADAIARNLMRNSIFGVWYTQEVEALFKYIISTQSTSRPLILTGFDIQSSSDTDRHRAGFFKQVLEPLDSNFAQEVYDYDLDFHVRSNQNTFEDYLQDSLNEIVNQYLDVAAFLENYILEGANGNLNLDELKGLKIARQTALNVANEAIHQNQWNQSNQKASFELRDREMANNLIFLKEELYPEEKIIVWAHNYHIRHNHPIVDGAYLTGYSTMGLKLNQYFQEDLYTVGLFMYTGQAALNNRVIYDIDPATEGSLESIMHRTSLDY